VNEAPPSKPPGPFRAYRWWVVAMLWCVCFLNYADRQAVYSVFPVLKQEFHFDKAALGLIGSAFMWVYAAGALPAGYVGDRLRRKDVILGGCLFWSAVTVLTGWCGRFWEFVAVRALEGLGETFYFPASMSLLSDYHGDRTRSRALALHQSGVYAGTIAGSGLGAWLAERYGWRTGFYLFGLTGLVLALVLYRLLREPRRGEAEAPAAAPERPLSLGEAAPAVFRSPVVPVLMAVFVGANAVAGVFLAWTPTFLVDKFHFRLTAAGLSGTVFIHLASAASVPLGGVLADRLALGQAGGRMLVQALGLAVGATFVFLVGTTTNVAVLLTAMALFGACKGLYDANIFASLYDVVEPRARATASGLMNAVGWGGGALGTVAFGWLAGSGPQEEQVENMSRVIAVGGLVYLAGAALLVVAVCLFRRRAVV
jgi:MFS family permease